MNILKLPRKTRPQILPHFATRSLSLSAVAANLVAIIRALNPSRRIDTVHVGVTAPVTATYAAGLTPGHPGVMRVMNIMDTVSNSALDQNRQMLLTQEADLYIAGGGSMAFFRTGASGSMADFFNSAAISLLRYSVIESVYAHPAPISFICDLDTHIQTCYDLNDVNGTTGAASLGHAIQTTVPAGSGELDAINGVRWLTQITNTTPDAFTALTRLAILLDWDNIVTHVRGIPKDLDDQKTVALVQNQQKVVALLQGYKMQAPIFFLKVWADFIRRAEVRREIAFTHGHLFLELQEPESTLSKAIAFVDKFQPHPLFAEVYKQWLRDKAVTEIGEVPLVQWPAEWDDVIGAHAPATISSYSQNTINLAAMVNHQTGYRTLAEFIGRWSDTEECKIMMEHLINKGSWASGGTVNFHDPKLIVHDGWNGDAETTLDDLYHSVFINPHQAEEGSTSVIALSDMSNSINDISLKSPISEVIPWMGGDDVEEDPFDVTTWYNAASVPDPDAGVWPLKFKNDLPFVVQIDASIMSLDVYYNHIHRVEGFYPNTRLVGYQYGQILNTRTPDDRFALAHHFGWEWDVLLAQGLLTDPRSPYARFFTTSPQLPTDQVVFSAGGEDYYWAGSFISANDRSRALATGVLFFPHLMPPSSYGLVQVAGTGWYFRRVPVFVRCVFERLTHADLEELTYVPKPIFDTAAQLCAAKPAKFETFQFDKFFEGMK